MTRIVLGVLGLLLGAAAAGKLWLVATDPFADIKLGFPLFVIWLAILCEFGLAYLNLRLVWSGLRRYDSATSHQPPALFSAPIVWLLNVGFFSVLLAISLARWALGYVSCGCFGVFDVPIWATPILNLLVLGALTVIFPGTSTLKGVTRTWIDRSGGAMCDRSSPRVSRRKVMAGTVSGIGSGLLLMFVITTPRLWDFVTPGWLGRRHVEANPIQLTALTVGKESTGRVRLRNYTNQPIQIVGSTRSCSCIIADTDRRLIPPFGEREIEIRVRPQQVGYFHQRILLFVDCRQKSRVVVDVVGFASKVL